MIFLTAIAKHCGHVNFDPLPFWTGCVVGRDPLDRSDFFPGDGRKG